MGLASMKPARVVTRHTLPSKIPKTGTGDDGEERLTPLLTLELLHSNTTDVAFAGMILLKV